MFVVISGIEIPIATNIPVAVSDKLNLTESFSKHAIE